MINAGRSLSLRRYHISRTLQPCELRERGFIDFISRGNYLWRA
jgi:hypothetical protein